MNSMQGGGVKNMSQDKRRQRGFSRRKFMQTTAAGAAAAAGSTLLGSPAQASKSKKPNLDPDVILENGRIHTMDANGTVASSVAIKDGRFMAIERGRSHIRAGRKTRVIDLRGRTVVPGIIDNHNHLVLMGNRPGYHTPLENALCAPGSARHLRGARPRIETYPRPAARALDHHDRWLSSDRPVRQPERPAERPHADARRARQRHTGQG